MSKKYFLARTLFLLMATSLCVTFQSCGGSDDDELQSNKSADNGSGIDPSVDIPDPEGTIRLSMRNWDNGKTVLGSNICIKNDNFSSAGNYSSTPCYVDLGAMKGLGNISKIPTIGWAKEVAVIPGHGYMAYEAGKYYRIYVIDEMVGTSGGVIGAEIKYHVPFYGVDEAIQLPTTTLIVDNSKESGYGYHYYYYEDIYFNNKEIVKFSATSDQSWCQAEGISSYQTINEGMSQILSVDNGIHVSCEKESTPKENREATITITTAYGKETKLKVVQLGKTE